MSRRPTVFLFDIDGTLVSTGGAGRKAIERAFVEHTGTADVLNFSFAGMTDPAIVRLGLTNAQKPTHAEAIAQVLESYLLALAEEVAQTPSFVIHPAVIETINQLATWAHCAIGLGTGNIKNGARVKLNRASLFERFHFGGFGCDSEDRAELIATGAQRGAARLGVSLVECRVVVIGDTPKDVAAARAIGAQSLAVATGPYSSADLAACGATWAVESLAAAGVVEMLLGEWPETGT
ncbi:MAG: HAD hydrolase-like protein [Polyangiaceae bacterium]|nr:HAD hydrolase-like protein [Polyangiaceae bacterium]